MLPKPGILKGGVKEFIDIAHLVDEDCEIQTFYLQPFQPKMITEYFEGWEDRTKEAIIFINKNIECAISIFPNLHQWIIERNRKDETYGLDIMPETLSQFITCCSMADINLLWRQ